MWGNQKRHSNPAGSTAWNTLPKEGQLAECPNQMAVLPASGPLMRARDGWLSSPVLGECQDGWEYILCEIADRTGLGNHADLGSGCFRSEGGLVRSRVT